MTRICFIALATLIGCGTDPVDSFSSDPIDDLPQVPDVSAGSGTVRFDLEERIIPARSESVLCHFLEKTDEEIFVTAFESFQGSHGHHLIIFKARIEDVPGTVRSCSTAADMANFTPVISSVNFGLEEFPTGMAIRVPKGAQIVLQQHYVNTSNHDIRVKDVGLMHTVPPEQVEVLAGFLGLSDIFFELPARQQSIVSFDCAAPRDMNLLLLGPHMHEHGRHFVASHVRGEQRTDLIDVEWRSDYRDFPPVTHFGKDTPLLLQQGDVISTSCSFDNTSDEVLVFPEEMCATYGYFFPATAGSDEFLCAADQN